MYRVIDAALLRAVTHVSLPGVVLPDLADDASGQVAGWRRWLRQVWANQEITAAIEVASPALAHRVRQVCEGRELPTRQVRGVVLSVLRYLLRMSRPTPFGLFAGIAPAHFGPRLAVRIGHVHHARARVDNAWLELVVVQLERCPDLLRRLPVVVNDLLVRRDDRAVVSCQRPPGSTSGTAAAAEVSVRRSKAVETVIRAAASPILVQELIDKLDAEFATAPVPVVDGMVRDLVAQGILLTSLRAPMTVTDPLAHVLDELTAVEADAIPLVADMLGQLRALRDDLAHHNETTNSGRAHALRQRVATRMRELAVTERPISVDLRLDADLVLPETIAREVEAAAATLTRLAPHPTGSPAWRDYHAQFLERYGIGAVVPLATLVRAETGLGFPAGYRDATVPPPPIPALTERDAALLGLAQRATMTQDPEVVLDEETIQALAVAEPTTVQPHTELRLRLHAHTVKAVERGEYEIVLTGVSRAAGTTVGRFVDLLGPADRQRMVDAYTGLPTVSADAIPVQVSCPPLSARAENVARAPAVLPTLISLTEHPSSGRGSVIPLDDLAITADARRLAVMSLSRQQLLEPVVFSALEFVHQAHPLLRMLCEISTARSAACAPWSWGAASRLPVLPRVRFRRVILSPARWRLTTAALRGPDAPWPVWLASLTSWRRDMRVPRQVYLGEDDRRLPLDFDEAAHLPLLRAELDRTGHATLREAPSPDGFGWFGGRAHEITVPLSATQPPTYSTLRPRFRRVRPLNVEHGHLPGASNWLHAKLYAPARHHTAILTTHLPDLLSSWAQPPLWWFLPYQDPEQHLRLRIQLGPNLRFADAAQHVSTWAAGLRRAGLIRDLQFATYYPETGRYGQGPAMAAAEAVFAADSAAALAQMTAAAHRGGPHPQALIAASLLDLAISVIGDLDEGVDWLLDHAGATSGPALDRALRTEAMRLADPAAGGSVLRDVLGGERIAVAWTRRRAALRTYREALTSCGEAVPAAALPDLLHLHHVRAAGVDLEAERTCLRLARAAALSYRARTRKDAL
ncbi:lantibiotic dehydratase [Longimycelium tulufanense]|uniref:lantibiotic dehydratase n=1 Tax=Longimycelium tulufanense TaxID=907463 RepID=UPI0016659B87|nr:lantibiotic dehydratase [Longimycelium tulufanense]